ncbi:hypothetical protein ACFFX0_18555 [Citricoccus parietis]|uniref:Uncharacterized protein n=1 Tax=Citricoccus parietis TaxID=592307 RepID=A0ABV5G2D7_9MICC
MAGHHDHGLGCGDDGQDGHLGQDVRQIPQAEECGGVQHSEDHDECDQGDDGAALPDHLDQGRALFRQRGRGRGLRDGCGGHLSHSFHSSMRAGLPRPRLRQAFRRRFGLRA